MEARSHAAQHSTRQRGRAPGRLPGPVVTGEHSAYYEAIGKEDELLQRRMKEIRDMEDAGQLSVRAAADHRIGALEQHLTAVRILRRKHLGPDGR